MFPIDENNQPMFSQSLDNLHDHNGGTGGGTLKIANPD